MSENIVKRLTPAASKTDPDMLFRDKEGNILPVTEVHLNEDSNIESIYRSDPEIVQITEEFSFEKHLLFIPGVGHVCPGVRLIYKEKDYVLLFGWHTNISNQTIYSWYLHSLDDDSPDKTLYKSMIEEIETVHFR